MTRTRLQTQEEWQARRDEQEHNTLSGVRLSPAPLPKGVMPYIPELGPRVAVSDEPEDTGTFEELIDDLRARNGLEGSQ